MFVRHDICPDDFFAKDDMSKRLILAFTEYELEQENASKAKNNLRKGAK